MEAVLAADLLYALGEWIASTGINGNGQPHTGFDRSRAILYAESEALRNFRDGGTLEGAFTAGKRVFLREMRRPGPLSFTREVDDGGDEDASLAASANR